jgi:hypothetical protein
MLIRSIKIFQKPAPAGGKTGRSCKAGHGHILRRLFMKKLYRFFGIIVIGAAAGLIMAGCTTADWTAVADGLTTANSNMANSYSSASETGMVYNIYNKSSVTVTLYDSTGSVSIPPYGYTSARFNNSITIYDVSYSPSSVNVSQSGYSFTFTD